MNRESLIRLNQIPGVGSATIHRLLSAFKTEQQMLDAGPQGLREILGARAQQELIEAILRSASDSSADQELERARSAGIRIITLEDPDYPELLRTIPDPPPVLYVKGTLIQEDAAAVAIVGTRAATLYGLATARRLATELGRAGITVISGLAEGIDGVAHDGALQGRGRTIAVLGHGLNHLFPARHRGLASRIIESGCLVSEFPMEMPPSPANFPRRNRVIAGLSLGTVVVEAPLRSGALITAHEALEQGREVFAVPGPVSSVNSRGTHQLLREGARLVEQAWDVLEELAPHLKARVVRWDGTDSKPEAVDSPEMDLSEEERAIHGAIPSAGTAAVDDLVQATEFSPARLLSLLTSLELKGRVRQVPGQGYSRLS